MFRYPYPSRTENGLYDRFRHPYARLCYPYYLCFLYIMFPYPLPQSNWKRSVYVSLPLPQSKWECSMTDVSTPTTVEMKTVCMTGFATPILSEQKKSHNLSRIGIRYRFWRIENSPLNLTGRDGRFGWLPYTSSVDVKGRHPSCHHTGPTVLHYSTKTLSLQIMRWWWCGA